MRMHIIGGSGQMGQWLKKFLESQGIAVTISGRKNDGIADIKTTDVIFISVPISAAPEEIKKVSKQITSNQLLVDLSSIKSETAKALEESGKPALLMHHLFGPTISSLQNQKIIYYTINKSQFTKPLLDLFEKNGAQLIEMDPEEHDKQMALIQCLTHFLNISLAHSLIYNKVDLHGKISTPVFLNQLSVLSRVLDQDPKLLAEIQLANPLYPKILEECIRHQEKFLNLIKDKNMEQLETELNEIHERVTPKRETPSTSSQTQTATLSDQNMSLGYLGPKGTFSHQAAQLLIQSSKNELRSLPNLRAIFESIAKGKIDLGLVPAENSTEGTIRETLDFLVEYDLKTVGSIELPVHQNLLSCEKNLADISTIYSHPQSIAQTRDWCSKNLAHAKIIPAASNLSQVETEKDKKGVGFIGPSIAADLYGLHVLAKDIEDNPNNITKFYLIAKGLNRVHLPTTKTVLFLTIFNRVGILRDILSIFADSDINLSKLESRPSKEKNWDYYFFIEVEVQYTDAKLTQTLNILRQYCPKIIVLGGI